MTWEIVNTLFGPEVLNTAPRCRKKGCTNPAHNMGYKRYRKYCYYHHKVRYEMGGYVYKKHRKEYCENIDGRYGFVCTSTIVAPLWQLEVDHIDGNHKNNQIVNLQTLCSCCHRYKTMIFQENLKVERRKNYHEKIFENTFGKQNENPIQSRSEIGRAHV